MNDQRKILIAYSPDELVKYIQENNVSKIKLQDYYLTLKNLPVYKNDSSESAKLKKMSLLKSKIDSIVDIAPIKVRKNNSEK